MSPCSRTTPTSTRDTLSVTSATDPPNGTAVVNGDNTITYTPDAGYNGSDSFDYTVSDGHGGTDTATVNVTVSSENDTPVAVDDSATTPEDTAVSVTVLANDSDPDADTLGVTGATDPANGSVTVNGDNTITYTPDANYSGADSFDYTISDGNGGTDTATVSITVTPANDAPVANNSATGTNEDQVLNMPTPGLLGHVTDADADPCTVSLVDPPAHGGVVVNANGSFTYTPNANWSGTDSFTYRAWDGTAFSNTASMNVAVSPVNDAPVAVDDSASTPSGHCRQRHRALRTTPTSTRTRSLSRARRRRPHGAAVVNGDNTVTYTPTAGYHGSDSFDYTISDGHGGTDTGIVNVTIQPPAAHPATIPIAGTGVTLYFGSLTETNTSNAVPVDPSAQHPAIPNFGIAGGTYYDISTTAEYTGDVDVTLSYDDTGMTPAIEMSLALYHWEGGAWHDITISRDTVANTITGRTSSFSDFVIMGPLVEEPSVVSTPASSTWSLALLGVLALAALLPLSRRGRRV